MTIAATILTNDDGIDAPGLAALRAAVDATPVLIVAPAQPQSGCGHSVSTTTLHIERRGEWSWAIHGTPADCVRVALLHILPELGINAPPERLRVLSGINDGGNLGADIYASGTAAAAREATFLGVPAMALSQYRGQHRTDWARTTRWARNVLAELATHAHVPGQFWNVNFPSLPENASDPSRVFCPRSTDPLPVKYRHDAGVLTFIHPSYQYRLRRPGTDVDVCFSGQIALTAIEL